MINPTSLPDDFDTLAARRFDEYRRIVIVFGVAWIVRLMHILSLKASPIFTYKIGDAARYDSWARTLADGNWLGEGVFYQAPLYPYFLGVVYTTLGDSILTVRLVQSLLGAASCVLLMLAATNLFGKRSGMISGLCLAFYAPSIFLEGLIQKSTLDLFFLTLLLWLISKIVYRPWKRYWLTSGVSIGALCLTRENALVLVPIFMVWIVFGSYGSLRSLANKNTDSSRLSRLGWLATFGIGLALTLGPVACRNYFVGGQFHLTTSQLGPNFYIGNNPDADGSYQPLRPGRGDAQFEQLDAVFLAEQAMGRELSPKEVSQYYLNQSLDFIRSQPMQWLSLMATKFGLTFNRHEIIDTEDQYTVAKLSPVLWVTQPVFHFGLLVPLALFGIYWTRSRWQRLWAVYLMMLAFAATVIAFFVFGRYRFPLAPPLMLFLGPAFLGLHEMVRRKKIGRMVSTATILAALFAACNLNLVSGRNGKAITLSNYGVQALIRDDYKSAESFLVASVDLQPDSALIHNNIGVLYRETNRPELALKHFHRAMELEPNDATIQGNLEKMKLARNIHSTN